MSLKLIYPGMEHEAEMLALRQEFFDANEQIIHGSNGFDHAKDYKIWVVKADRNRYKDTVEQGYVPASICLAQRTSDGMIIGTIDMRHKLNEQLLQQGGHIGYSVRPSERQKGYAKEMMQLALNEYREKLSSEQQVLLTCDVSNLASAKTILASGGILEDVVTVNGVDVNRYWITL